MITLQDVTSENFETLLALEVRPGQEQLGYSVAESLARAYVRADGPQYTYMPKAVYFENEPVGFIMIVYDPGSTDDYWLTGALVDQKHQGIGHAKGAVIAALNIMRRKLVNCRVVQLTCHPDNQRVINMVTALGFAATGEHKDDEIVYRMELRR
jgi:RimJ/RimL family protein N-acetyltransferase